VSVSSVARDASSPGLALDPEYSATFTTSATGAVVADAGGPYSIQSGVSIQLDGSLSVAAAGIDTWSWEITAPGGAVSFASGERPNVQFAVVGQYTVLLRVTDVLGNSATDSTTLTVTAIGGSNFLADYWWLFVILILGVVGGLIFLLAGKRRKKDEETMPPEVPPEYVETVPPARVTGGPSLAPRGPPVAPPVGAAPGKPMTRECPTCGTIVDTTDTECFMCGSRL